MLKNSTEKLNFFKQAFNSEEFRQNGHKIVDILADYMEKASSGRLNYVLPPIEPDEMMNLWDGEFSAEPGKAPDEMVKKVVKYSNHLLHTKYIGHQVISPLPLAALFSLTGSLLNNSTAVYEMAPSVTIMERNLIKWMSNLIGFRENSDGIFTSGGTLGNLTALLAARQAKSGYDIWTEGSKDSAGLAVMVSEQCHYSVKRALQVMGMGETGVVTVPCDEAYCLDTEKLEEIYEKAINEGKKVIAVAASACSTATGSYDDLEKIGEFCGQKGLWFHVDGAHGASALLSEKYKGLLNGIHRADSVVWDAHKMMLMPALSTAVLFKNSESSYEAFSQKASYLFEKEAREEWYNMAHRTMECTKPMMAFNLYACLSVYGTKFFGDYIDHVYDLTKEFAEVINQSPDFELAIEPEGNIICFRYLKNRDEDINELQFKIRKKIISEGSFYLVQTVLRNKAYLRCTIINPLTTIKDLKELLDKVREVA